MSALQRTGSITLTTEEQNAPLILHLKNPPTTVEKLQRLLAEMKVSCAGFASPNNQKATEAISAWEEQFFANYQIDSPDVTSTMKAVYALAFFYFNRVEFIMRNKDIINNPKDKVQWFKFYCRVKEIIAESIPQEKKLDGDTFLKNYRVNILKKPLIKEVAVAIDLFQRIEMQLFAQANEINEMLMTQFEALKIDLLDLWQESEKSSAGLYERLDKLTKHMTDVFLELKISMKQMETIENKLQKLELEREQHIQSTEKILSNI